MGTANAVPVFKLNMFLEYDMMAKKKFGGRFYCACGPKFAGTGKAC